MNRVTIQITAGELYDRVSILDIKRELSHVASTEYHRLVSLIQLPDMYQRLLTVNRQLWELEDEMQDLLDDGNDVHTATCGRKIARWNRMRSGLKNEINEATGHEQEFKKYGTNKCPLGQPLVPSR